MVGVFAVRPGARWESKPRLWRYPGLVEGALSEVVVDIDEGSWKKDDQSLWSRVGEFVGRDEGDGVMAMSGSPGRVSLPSSAEDPR